MMKKVEKLMKKDHFLVRLMAVVLMLVPLLLSSSCQDAESDILGAEGQSAEVSSMRDDIRWANAIVTVRRSSLGRNYFQLDEYTTLDPVGWDNPFSEEVRALVAYSDLNQKTDFCTKAVEVERIDSIVTRDAAYINIPDGLPGGTNLPVSAVQPGFESVKEMFDASSPVDIVTDQGIPDWMTFSEDGYLMIHFATFWGDVTRHSVNLYASLRHPDHLYLVHKDNGDMQSSWEESLVAFRICQMYMSRKDEYKDPGSIVLHWMSFSGEKTLRLKYGNRATER